MEIVDILELFAIWAVVASALFVMVPLIMRWQGTSSEADRHFYSLTTVVWPVTLPVFLAILLIRFPARLLRNLQDKLDSYLDSRALRASLKKEEDRDEQRRLKRRVVELEEKRFNQDLLTYRESNCGGCGQSLSRA
jgi:cell shape-determining protein MreC